ncbi:sensor histidine kinase [Bacteroides sp. AM10-21B]|uniref:sensor histidine kinase n=1 Tax=Bacteroides sp. AM10-21B TaxID=2292001 RepID=UPI000E51CB39|nr:histidine kinase dimerization/phospho-acceptor domain-containing protein [Bacteroides sp. AM10-21B]RHJ48248.1 sensor histidine kinase [Bacteroides sp. AM10-21B]
MKKLLIIGAVLALLLSAQAADTKATSQHPLPHQRLMEMQYAINRGIRQADSLVRAGKPEEALSFYKKSLKAKDSLYNLVTTSQMKEILSLYNVDKLVLQKEQRRSLFHQISLLISIIIIIALLFFNIRIYRSRKRLQEDEKEMKRLTAIAEEANEIKSRFLTNMSYNIRIPLNNVVGFSQLMTEDTGLNEEEKREYSGIIQNNSTELIQLVNNVLDLSRLEANMMKFQLQNYNVQEWCNELPCLIQMQSEGRIFLELQADAGDAIIHTDVSRFTQMIFNMLLYPVECQETRKVRMQLNYQPENQEISCRIENSPLADPAFASQKTAIHQRIAELFFQHFGGSFRIEKESWEIPTIVFTYPSLTT